ncbi:YkgB family protein [Chryseobacterium sp. JUb7]|uniref:YkgB family protein n=1 Tax=Chryseobacterium sp. JUb7 TaxID=2940599 RepID=UPI002169CC4D|nr:YkgB family protein [Chryseobacterium sp. JUb7]MCS3529515.1 putative membrane protein YkgB [Chryseobacterium sp. JUb7]
MNGTTLEINTKNRTGRIGYYISLFGTALILLWIGIFKFTPTEAAGIKNLVENHFLTFFVYDIVSVQTVSNAIGAIEIIIALLLLFSVKFASLRKYAAIGMIVTFLTTLSYLFTTSGIWKVVDGIPVTDFFILKDLMFLGFGLMILNGKNEYK